MTEWVKDTATGFIDEASELGENVNKLFKTAEVLKSIVTLCDMMADEHARTKQKWKDIAEGANAKRP